MDNFVYDSEGNLTEDKSKNLKISYDWRGMPTEFVRKIGCYDYHGVALCASTRLTLAYDGSGRRISKTRYSKNVQYGYWTRDVVTHYTGIGTEVREAMRRSASPKTTVVVNLPQGLGRYLPEDAEKAAGTAILLDKDGKPVFMGEATPEFEWYLKNHLGSTMLVYGSQPYNDKYSSYAGGVKAAYDYRAFGEQVDLAMPTDKVTENFTGKEKDDETELNYFGARYLDPMLGMWTSVDPARQFSSPYLYVGNGVNPVVGVDPDGNYSLNLNEDNTVASMTSDEYDNTISVYDANGDFLNNFEAPDAGSYFFSKNNNGEYNIINKVFDVNMQKNANEMMFEVNSSFFPFSYVKWYSGFDFDFKHRYYSSQGQSVYTIGALNGTIMTARDAGNALWGALMRDRGWSRSTTNYISDKIAGGKEDFESKSMQMWGYDKVYEQMKISSPK